MQILEEQEGARHRRQLVEYTGADTRIPAFLLLPDLTPAVATGLAAVLAIHQDGDRATQDIGKSEPAGLTGDADQRYGLELCQRGYVVLCPDRGGFESRQQVASRFSGLGAGLFELRRAVDCLLAHPAVDGRRIGVIGHSAGGWWAAMLMFIDPRLRAGATSCSTWLWRWSAIPKERLPPGYHLAKPPLPGLLDWGDQDDILAGIAPRAYLETRGDVLPPFAPADLTGKARARYEQLGVPERFDYVAYGGGPHRFREDMRERSYAWLDRWLAAP